MRVAEHISSYDMLLEIVKKKKVGWHLMRAKRTLANAFCTVKLSGKDHEEGQQDTVYR